MTTPDATPHPGRRATRIAVLVCLLGLGGIPLLALTFDDPAYWILVLTFFLLLSPAVLLHLWLLWRLRRAAPNLRRAFAFAAGVGVVMVMLLAGLLWVLYSSRFDDPQLYVYFGLLILAHAILAAFAFKARRAARSP